jgi:hypothetical protein
LSTNTLQTPTRAARSDSITLRAISGIITFSSSSPDNPPTVTAASLPITCAPTWRTDSGMTGLTLPGMMDEPAGSPAADLVQAGARADAIHRTSLAILIRLTAIVLSAPEISTSASREPCASKWSSASRNGSPVRSSHQLDDPVDEPGRTVQAGAHRGPAERQLVDGVERLLHPRDPELDLPRVPGELLAERHRGGVHQVRAPGLDHPDHSSAFARSAPMRGAARPGSRSSFATRATATCTEVGKVSFDDCDAFTWSFGCTGRRRQVVAEQLLGPVRDDLVDVHVRRGARPGLEHVDGEVHVELRRRSPRRRPA